LPRVSLKGEEKISLSFQREGETGGEFGNSSVLIKGYVCCIEMSIKLIPKLLLFRKEKELTNRPLGTASEQSSEDRSK